MLYYNSRKQCSGNVLPAVVDDGEIWVVLSNCDICRKRCLILITWWGRFIRYMWHDGILFSFI